MSTIRYIDVDNNPVVFNSWTDFFNPLKNRRWNYSGHHNTIDWWIKSWTALYCKENLRDRDIAKVICFDGVEISSDEHDTLKLLIEPLNDDDMWLFALLRRRGRFSISGSRFNFIVPGYVSDSSYFGCDTDITTLNDPTPENFPAKLLEAKEKWLSAFARFDTTQKLWSSDYIPNLTYFHSYYRAFSTCSCFCSYSNDTIDTVTVRELLQEHPYARYSVRITGERTVSISLSIPVTSTNRSPLYNIHHYSMNVLDILPYPNIDNKEKGSNPVLVGVELECATDYSMKQLIDAADEPFFLGKSDSSITGNRRTKVELVTAPSSFKYLKRQYALWFNKLEYDKFDTSVTTNNGMHVHIGREHFEDNIHIRNFCWFWNNPANTDFIVYLSERGSLSAMMHYSPIYIFPAESSRTQAFKDIYRIIGTGFRGVTNFKGGWEKAKTVEVRAFRGIVSYASIVKNLEAVEAVFNFTRGLTSYRELTLTGFLRWLKQTPANKYTLLKKFIDQAPRLPDYVITSELKDVVFTETNPEKVLALLKKSSLKLTNKHITLLNKGKKRTFIIDKETGELKLSDNNRSKLFHLDKTFAERYLRSA